MTTNQTLKVEIRDSIMKALERDKCAQKSVLVASFKLETGFTEKVIEDILDDLAKINKISIQDNNITLVKQDG